MKNIFYTRSMNHQRIMKKGRDQILDPCLQYHKSNYRNSQQPFNLQTLLVILTILCCTVQETCGSHSTHSYAPHGHTHVYNVQGQGHSHPAMYYHPHHTDDQGTLAGDVQNWAMLIQNYILWVSIHQTLN